MRKMLNTLFVLTPDTYLTLDNEAVVIKQGEETRQRIPLLSLESILYFGYHGASPRLMGYCGEHGIRLSFLTPEGKFLAAVSGENKGNILLRKEQYRLSQSEEGTSQIAKNFVLGKVYNARWVLERAIRDHEMRINADRVRSISQSLKKALPEIRSVESMDILRGIEGKSAAAYFSVFDELILNQKEAFFFRSRSRRPPLDPINALLSFAYSLLTNDCAAALESVGLDPYCGFMHTDRPGRKSLALDLVEELRSVFADRFVLSLVNQSMLGEKDFVKKENGAVFLSDDGRKVFLTQWQKKKKESITHPFLGEKLEWGLVPYAQSLLLARTVRGDLEEYPPFFWK